MKHQKTDLTPRTGITSVRAALHTVLLMALCLAGLTPKAQALNTFILSNAVTLIPTGTGNLTGGTTAVRGMAYNAVSNQVIVVNNGGTIDAFDGTSGALVGPLSTTGVTGGTFALDQAGVGADGTIYAVNLGTGSGSSNKIYMWTNWQASPPIVAFNSNALGNGAPINYTSGRMGDTLAVTGSGTNTLLLEGVGGNTNFILYYTTTGTNFNQVIVNVQSGYTAGGNVFGICFFTNNTFLVKSASAGNSTVYLIQFPNNYASQSIVTGTVLGTATLGASFTTTTMLSYDATDGLLAAAATGNGGTTTPLGLFAFNTLAAGPGLLSISNAATTYVGGNATGGVVINGTNSIYELTTGNPVYQYPLASVPAQGPGIVTPPVGGTYYLSDTLTIGLQGTPPFTYQWLASSNNTSTSTTFTNIPGATASSLTVTSAGTNYYEVIISNVVTSITSTPVQVAIRIPVTSTAVTNVWRVAAGASGYSYLTTDDACRGLAYDTNLQRLVVVNKSGPTANILSAINGTNIGTLSVAGISGGTFALNQVAIGDDGAVYGGNLVTGGGGFTLYRWPAATNTAVATQVFQDAGSLGGADRWGDTMAIRGGGVNTQILLGSRTATNIALLTTTDGTNFTGEYIAISGANSGFAQNGITFGTGNSLWAKSYGNHLYEIAYDPVAQTGSVLLDYPNPTAIPSTQIGIGVDTNNNIMAGIDEADSPHDVKLYQLTGSSAAPVLFDQSFFASATYNGNENAVIVMKYPRLFALDVNNGLVALTYGVPPTTPPSISTPPANLSAYTNDPAASLSVSVSGSLPIFYQWQFSTSSNGPFANIGGATNGTYTINYPTAVQAGYYQVIVHNFGGTVTSTPPALLTVLVPASYSQVSNLWSIPGGAGGSLNFLDNSSYQTRGLAYDTNTQQLAVADHMNLHLLGTNGAYVGDLSSAGVPVNGLNGWLYDQVGFADDGTLYAGNITLSGPGYSITAWAAPVSTGAGPVAYSYGGTSGADPGNGSGDRWGDTMAVRGSGTGTEILIGSYNGTNVVLFTTTDGVDFTANLIPVTGVPLGFSGQGIAFGAGDTFWTKSPGYDLRQVSFNRSTWTGTVVQDFTSGTLTPSAFDGISLDVAANVLAGVDFSDVPSDVRVYSLSGNTNAPGLVAQIFFGSVNPNSQLNAVTTLKGGLGFGLDVNNGIVGFSYGALPGPGVSITSIAYTPGNVTVNFNNTFNGHSYQLQSTTNLATGPWVNVGSAVTASGPTASASDTSSPVAATYYRVANN
jgi:hypothetical protein